MAGKGRLQRTGDPGQADLFAAIPANDGEGRPAPNAGDLAPKARARVPGKPTALRPLPPGAAPITDEEMVRRLEASGRYRVLRQLQPWPVAATMPAFPAGWAEHATGCGRAGHKLGVVLDTETTGLDHARDEVIDLGMLAFTYDESGIREVVGLFSGLREPTVPISPEITRITGITPEMVAGQQIDLQAVSRFIEPADLVTAHNARFDRPFCERLAGGFDVKPWACSVAEVDWAGLGFEGSKLGYLVGQCGWFHHGHRAVDDCHALLAVLARALPAGTATEGTTASAAATPFHHLLASAMRTRHRIFAEATPFHTKDVLKARGYRWNDGTDGRPKSWWTEVEEEAREAELAYLCREIYRRNVSPYVQRLTACERFRA